MQGIKILYNSDSQALFRLNKELPEDLTSMPASTLHKLLKLGIIVPDDLDETKAIYDRMDENMRSNDNFYLIVNPTLQCNCRCWYCIEHHVAQSRIDQSTMQIIKDTIISILNRVNSLTLSFFGGEPLLEYSTVVKPLMEWTKHKCSILGKKLTVMFTTNGLLLTKDMVNFFKDYTMGSFQITLDGGRDSHNKTRIYKNNESFDKVLSSIKLLTDNNMRVVLRLNLTKDNIDSAYGIVDELRDLSEHNKRRIALLCQQVWQDVPSGSLSREFIDIEKSFESIGIHPFRSEFNVSIQGCYADQLNCAVINYNGDIFKCSAVDYESKNSLGNLKHIDFFNTLESQYEKFYMLRTTNLRCRECRILPLCMKGCYNRVVTNAQDCLYPDDSQKDDIIMSIIEKMSVKKYNL